MADGIAILLAALRRTLAEPLRYLAVHAAVTLLGYLLLWPAFGVLYRAAVGLSGEAALADVDIAVFLLTPVGLAVIVVLAAALVTLLVLEVATMMALGIVGRPGAAAGLRAALAFVAARLPRILALAAHLVVRLLAMVLPAAAAIALVAWALLTGHDINYYLAARPPAFWTAVLLIGTLGLGLAGLVASRLALWSLALPLTLFAGFAPRAAFGDSARLVRSHRTAAIAMLAGWAGLTLVLGSIAAGAVFAAAAAVLPSIAGSLRATALTLGLAIVAFVLVQAAVRTVANASLALALVALLDRAAPGRIARAGPAVAVAATPRRWRGAVAAAALAVVAALATGAALLRGLAVEDDVLVIAHRGGALDAPENTLAAFARAIEDGADWIEIDVQERADGTVVVIHDRDLMRQAGLPLQVHEARADDLAAADVGSWFDPAFAGERVPTLAAVLAAARGRIGVLIELKYYGHQRRLEVATAAAVAEAGMEDAVAVMSLDRAGVARMHALRPDWPHGLLTSVAIGDLTRIDADFLAVNDGVATRTFIDRAHDRGRRVYAWTVNDPLRMSALASLGIDGLITDDPAAARRVLDERAELGLPTRLILAVASRFGATGR